MLSDILVSFGVFEAISQCLFNSIILPHSFTSMSQMNSDIGIVLVSKGKYNAEELIWQPTVYSLYGDITKNSRIHSTRSIVNGDTHCDIDAKIKAGLKIIRA